MPDVNTKERAMTHLVAHRLVGYGRATGHVAVEYEVPERLLEFAKRVAKVGADDPQAVLCYSLEDAQTHELAAAIGAKIHSGQLSFYLEGFVEVEPACHGAH
jgi:hypothetical protein